MDLVEQVIRVFDNYGFQTQIVVSEARNPIHVLDAALMGADVATLPAAVLEQLFRHPFTVGAARRETVVKPSADRVLYLSRVVTARRSRRAAIWSRRPTTRPSDEPSCAS